MVTVTGCGSWYVHPQVSPEQMKNARIPSFVTLLPPGDHIFPFRNTGVQNETTDAVFTLTAYDRSPVGNKS